MEPKQLKNFHAKKQWARATTKICVKIGNLEEQVVPLIDRGSEITIISYDVYMKGGWLM